MKTVETLQDMHRRFRTGILEQGWTALLGFPESHWMSLIVSHQKIGQDFFERKQQDLNKKAQSIFVAHNALPMNEYLPLLMKARESICSLHFFMKYGTQNRTQTIREILELEKKAGHLNQIGLFELDVCQSIEEIKLLCEYVSIPVIKDTVELSLDYFTQIPDLLIQSDFCKQTLEEVPQIQDFVKKILLRQSFLVEGLKRLIEHDLIKQDDMWLIDRQWNDYSIEQPELMFSLLEQNGLDFFLEVGAEEILRKLDRLDDLTLKEERPFWVALLSHAPRHFLNQPNEFGLCPLHVFAAIKKQKILSLLLEAGADPFCTTKGGLRPLAFFEEKQSIDATLGWLNPMFNPHNEIPEEAQKVSQAIQAILQQAEMKILTPETSVAEVSNPRMRL